jgi:predicted dinucleotide-binding enzyme
MKIGLIGYGNMAQALGSRWADKHELYVSGRDADKAKALAEQLGGGTRHGSEAHAAAFAEVGALAGKVLLDINNPVSIFDGDFLAKTFDGKSLAEAIAAYAPTARVVKAFNMCNAVVWQMEPPLFDGRRLVVLYCGDDAAAKQKVAGLIENTGGEPADLGELKYARLLEPAAAIVIKFILAGRDPHTVLNLIQPEVKRIA